MFSTVVFAAVLVGLLLALLVLWALFLRLGLRWAKVQDVTTRRIVLTTAIVVILQVALNVVFLSVAPSSDAESIVLGVVELAAAVIVPCTVISIVFKARFLRAFQAWLPTLLATVAALAASFLVVRPFVYEAFSNPTNAMAPTLVGPHWKGICPECGQPNYCTPSEERFGAADPLLLICENFHVTEAMDVDKTVHSRDRFTVAKFVTPRRWDLIVFKDPEEPGVLNVKRLVGLPGETVHIKDGSVWVDGQRQSPPDSIQGIEYSSAIPGWLGEDLWGSVDRPASLGDDEYFVLGDFSARSKDSRLWQRSAPGHNPFAVPESYLEGVVIHTYWPPHRWRIHR